MLQRNIPCYKDKQSHASVGLHLQFIPASVTLWAVKRLRRRQIEQRTREIRDAELMYVNTALMKAELS
jgi:hypothetical protein